MSKLVIERLARINETGHFRGVSQLLLSLIVALALTAGMVPSSTQIMIKQVYMLKKVKLLDTQ